MESADNLPDANPVWPGYSQMPARLFGAVMGLCGLALAWQRAQATGLSPLPGLAAAFLALALLTSMLVYLGYMLKVTRNRALAVTDLSDPALVTFMAGVPVSLMILPAGLLPHFPALAPLLAGSWWAGVVLHGALAAWLICRWVRSPVLLREITPAWFVPTVGMIVAPLAGVALGYWTVSFIVLAASVLMWLALLPIVLWRLAASPLPALLLPTLFVWFAPPALIAVGLGALGAPATATTAWFQAALVFAGIAAVMLFARRADLRNAPFTLGWWGTTFPLAALASAAIQYHAHTLTAASHLMALGLLGFATLVTAAVSILTARAIFMRH